MDKAQESKSVLERIRDFDKGIARGEAAITAVVLLTMIVVAFLQASVRNFSDWGFEWATAALAHIEWADTVLQKGTLWVAFLGASLATHEGRHIGIDILPRISGEKGKKLMRGVASFGAAVVSFVLARAFWAAVLINAREVPLDFQVFGDAGNMVHVCEATAAQLTEADAGSHPIFCALRSMMHAVGVGTPDPSNPLTAMGIGSPAAASQFIVPVIFVLMGIRLVFNGSLSFLSLYTGKDYGDESGEEAAAKKAAEEELKKETDEGPDDDAPNDDAPDDPGPDDAESADDDDSDAEGN